MSESAELLFFDTFSHESSEEINLDLVQFPKSVYVSEIRIIPLGARVQGDFPGGVRLGATNPTQFHIDFFVNDLSKPGASTFESLGSLDYCQNGKIHMECGGETEQTKIPTDGLVIRGWYSTITLAVYGNLVIPLNEVVVPTPPVIQTTVSKPLIREVNQHSQPNTINEQAWTQNDAKPIPTYTSNATNPTVENFDSYNNENYENNIYRNDFYEDQPKDPRCYRNEDPRWEKEVHDKELEKDKLTRSIDLDREHRESRTRLRSTSIERVRGRSRSIRTRSRSRDRDYALKRISNSRSRSRDGRERNCLPCEKEWDRTYDRDAYKRHRDDSFDRRLSPYEQPAYESTGSYGKRSPRGSSYEQRSPYYEKCLYEKRGSPYDRIRDNFRSRSRSREDPRRRPRTPSIDSVKRPYTPEKLEIRRLSPPGSVNSDDGFKEFDQNGKHYHFKHEIGIRSPSVENNLIQKPSNYIESKNSSLLTVKLIDTEPCPRRQGSIESPPNEDSAIDHELEPISDEDIADIDPESDGDYDLGDYCNEDIIKYYNPFKTEWRCYEYQNKPYHKTSDDINSFMNTSFEKYCNAISSFKKIYELTKLAAKREKKFLPDTFTSLEATAKEDWVHQCENFVLSITVIDLFTMGDVPLRILNNFETNNEFSELCNYLITFLKIGLNYENALSQAQPTYKIRHLKCGLKLAETILQHRHNGHVVRMLTKHDIDIISLLFNIYFQDYMALSLRLMVLRTLDAFLISKTAFCQFLETKKYHTHKVIDCGELNCNGYQLLIRIIMSNPLAQIKFSLKSLIKKINTYEMLNKFECIVNEAKINSDNILDTSKEFIMSTVSEVVYLLRTDCFDLSQPKRFLPASAQFDVNNEEATNDILIQLFESHKFIENTLCLITCPKISEDLPLKSSLLEMILAIIESSKGLKYLYRNYESAEMLFKYLMHPCNKQELEEYLYIQDVSNFNELQVVGLELAHKLRILYYLEAIKDTYNFLDALVDNIHSLYSLGFGNIGKMALAQVLMMDDNIQCISKLFYCQDKIKSLVSSYASEMIVNAVKLSTDVTTLKRHRSILRSVVDGRDRFEPSVISTLSELLQYLKPLKKTDETADEVTECVEIIKANINSVKNLPGELVTALLLLKSICKQDKQWLPPYKDQFDNLRVSYNTIKLYSLDGMTVLCSVLEKILECFDQPSLHSYELSSTRGVIVASICHCCVVLLDEIVSRVVQCQGSQFRDTTAIPVLLRIFGLLYAYPHNSLNRQLAHRAAQSTISALLAYAQPRADNADDGECLRKGPWTVLCLEVLSFTMSAPHNFPSGLLVFSELLPLPLPIATKRPLTPDEILDAIDDRRFWSAHLHTLSSEITDAVRTACASVDCRVAHALRRVCVQIADLAPNMATMIARAAIVSAARELPAGKPPTANCSRALAFLSCLLAHAPVKCGALQSVVGRSNSASGTAPRDLVWVLCTALRAPGCGSVQEYAANALACLCDVEVSLGGAPNDALPRPEWLEALLDATTDCLTTAAPTTASAAAILRSYFVLTEHEYGFRAFRRLLARRRDAFETFFTQWCASPDDWWESASAYAELLRVVRDRGGEGRGRLTRGELAGAVGWKGAEESPILQLETALKERNTEEDVLSNVTYIITTLQSPSDGEPSDDIIPECILPPTNTLITQFENRTVWVLTDVNDERLTEDYWFNIPSSAVEEVNDTELNQCNIIEIANSELSNMGGGNALLSAVRKLLGASECDTTSSTTVSQNTGHITQDKLVREKRPFLRAADAFRSRPPNTSRPPSLHVDDFLALEGRGAQINAPTGYNKMNVVRGARRGIAVTDRGRFASSTPQLHYRQMGAWEMGQQHFPHFGPPQYVFGNGWGGLRGVRGARRLRPHMR